MLINTSRKDRHNKLCKLQRISEFMKIKPDPTPNLDDEMFTVDTYDRFISGMQQLQYSLGGRNGDLMYRLQQVVQQNKETPLDLDTLWGYKPSSRYKVNARGLVQPFISYRVVRPYAYKMTRTIIIDSVDTDILANTTKIGMFDVSPITAFMSKNRHFIDAITIKSNMNIMDGKCLDILRAMIMSAQKYEVKYFLDLSRCTYIEPQQLLKWFNLYSSGSCKSLGIVGIGVDIATLQMLLMSQFNTDWLDVDDISVSINNTVSRLKNPQTMLKKKFNALTLYVDFNYKELYLKQLLRTLSSLSFNSINLVLETTKNLDITTSGSYIMSKLKNAKPNLYVSIDLKNAFLKNIVDIQSRYGEVQGIIFKNGSIQYVREAKDIVIFNGMYDDGSDFEIRFKRNEKLPLNIINICKTFNGLSYLITEVSDKIKLIYIDEDDVIDFKKI